MVIKFEIYLVNKTNIKPKMRTNKLRILMDIRSNKKDMADFGIRIISYSIINLSDIITKGR